MALPSAHRPPDMDSLLAQGNPRGSSLMKLKIDKKETFMEEMISWHHRLTGKQKSELTKKRVIRHATTVAYRLKLPYENLPADWLRILYEEHGVIFKFSKGRKKKFEEEKKEDDHLSLKIFEKKLIDLSNEPPPPEWLTAYTDGTAVQRVLRTFINNNGVMVVYYDYSPNLKNEDGSECERPLHHPYDRDGVFRF